MALSGLKKWIIKKFVDSVVGDIAKGEYGMLAMKVWEWLNGRKMALGLLVTFLGEVQLQAPAIVEAFGGAPEAVAAVTRIVGGIVIVVGALHKTVKGS